MSTAVGFLRVALWSLAAAVLIVAGVMFALRHRMATNLYKVSSDEQ